ncbi:PREDICTED: uncharacterized protein LOC108368353 [Rhagoletis zephyria]|uniref:uncharacterized protein LOC108368353 n=1 Tax=Rhagoletis zephyria TaxID=28612 RepID=UPI0008112055|nr:PREDICTED: uncharacterized protein LOC108368353 [Rhagoletis zephyria]
MTLIWIQPTKGLLTSTKLTDQVGFIDIQMRTQEIVKDTDIVLHLINIKEIESVVNEMTDNIILMKTNNKDILHAELLETRNKLMTLVPNPKRKARGLENAIGSVSKWMFGTMDDNDRQIIQNHLLKTDETVNEQIHINDYFNLAIEQIKNIVRNDRKEIGKSVNVINKIIDEEYQQIF